MSSRVNIVDAGENHITDLMTPFEAFIQFIDLQLTIKLSALLTGRLNLGPSQITFQVATARNSLTTSG